MQAAGSFDMFVPCH